MTNNLGKLFLRYGGVKTFLRRKVGQGITFGSILVSCCSRSKPAKGLHVSFVLPGGLGSEVCRPASLKLFFDEVVDSAVSRVVTLDALDLLWRRFLPPPHESVVEEGEGKTSQEVEEKQEVLQALRMPDQKETILDESPQILDLAPIAPRESRPQDHLGLSIPYGCEVTRRPRKEILLDELTETDVVLDHLLADDFPGVGMLSGVAVEREDPVDGIADQGDVSGVRKDASELPGIVTSNDAKLLSRRALELGEVGEVFGVARLRSPENERLPVTKCCREVR